MPNIVIIIIITVVVVILLIIIIDISLIIKLTDNNGFSNTFLEPFTSLATL
jgi:hypothetical protein